MIHIKPRISIQTQDAYFPTTTMCEIRRCRFPSCCNREKWITTKNAAFCESMAPGARCRPRWCLFIGKEVVEAEGWCEDCERAFAFGEVAGERVIGGGLEMEMEMEGQIDVEGMVGGGKGGRVKRRRCR